MPWVSLTQELVRRRMSGHALAAAVIVSLGIEQIMLSEGDNLAFNHIKEFIHERFPTT